jgi:hypothetical protein
MEGSFWKRFEEWAPDRETQDADLLEQLTRDYRTAWMAGDREDLYAVLDFVRSANLTSGLDLIIEGIQSDDEGVATHAVVMALFMIAQGTTFDPLIRTVLEDAGRRFPIRRALTDATLTRLSELPPDG